MKQIELLAPAKNYEVGKAAIDAGADAVYIGAEKFGARASASNQFADIEKLVNYAHFFNSKVYITLNTLLFDNELDEARKMVWQLYNAGCDAIIIQDMSFLMFDLPPIQLFASTQTDNRSVERVKFLQAVGFKRVILARELSLKQIGEIAEKTNIELECFIHGSLCVSYSGQCYMSSAICNRSANRGECSQPCRSAYNLLDNQKNILIQNKHLLSLKDLNLSDYLQQLIEVGVTSFKIEGRLKDLDYVKNIVAFYRQKIDEIIKNKTNIQKTSSGKSIYAFTPNPEKTFNRTYTTYFIEKREKAQTTFLTQKALGEEIGTVKYVSKNWFSVKTEKTINNADGLCFFDKHNEMTGLRVNKTEGEKIFVNTTEKLQAGITVYRNHDQQFNKQLNSDSSTVRKIAVELLFQETENGFSLKAKDEDANEVEFALESEKTQAKNIETAKNQIETQLKKSGETNFEIKALQINLKSDYFISISILNNLRRNVLEMLKNERLNNYKADEYKIERNNFVFPKPELDYSNNVVNSLAEEFYKQHGVEKTENGFELDKNKKNKKLMTTKYCILFEIGKCLKTNSKNEIHLPLFLENNKQLYRLEFDCTKCEMQIL